LLWEKLFSLNWTAVLQTAGGIALTIVIGAAVLALGRRGLKALGHMSHVSKTLVGVLRLVLRWVVFVIVALLVITQLGVNLGSLWAVLSALLAIVGIGFVAVWSLLSNVSSTLLLLIFHPFTIGDEIEVIETTGGPGLRGRVMRINFMYTMLEEKEPQTGEVLVTLVPNSTFFQKTIRLRSGGAAVSSDHEKKDLGPGG
jgi:small-conductance mechanosensitive channel